MVHHHLRAAEEVPEVVEYLLELLLTVVLESCLPWGPVMEDGKYMIPAKNKRQLLNLRNRILSQIGFSHDV
jgi:hypothetical protein